jgi:hypothetical protein
MVTKSPESTSSCGFEQLAEIPPMHGAGGGLQVVISGFTGFKDGLRHSRRYESGSRSARRRSGSARRECAFEKAAPFSVEIVD